MVFHGNMDPGKLGVEDTVSLAQTVPCSRRCVLSLEREVGVE